MISGFFPLRGYDDVRRAFFQKYGGDETQQGEARGKGRGEVVSWETDDCLLFLQGKIDKENASFLLYHRELNALAESRNPGPRMDDF